MPVKATLASCIKEKKTDWIWKGFIPRGNVTMILGKTGAGKTSLLVRLMTDWGLGDYPPGSDHGKATDRYKGNPLNMFFVTRENGLSGTIIPQMIAFGADRTKIYCQDRDTRFILGVEDIKSAVDAYHADVVIIDPWHHFLPSGVYTSGNQDLVEMIDGIAEFAEERNITVILTGNYSKNDRSDTLSRGLGGSSLYTTLRSVLNVVREEDGDIIVTAEKMSVGLGDNVKNTVQTLFMGDDYVVHYGDASLPDLNESMRKKAEILTSILSGRVLRSQDVSAKLKLAGMELENMYDVAKRIGVIFEKLPDRSSAWYFKSETELVKQQLAVLREEAATVRKENDLNNWE